MGIEALAAPKVGGLTASFGAPIGRIGVGIEGGFKVGRPANFAENRGPSLLNPLGRETIRNPFAPKRVQAFAPINPTFGRFSVANFVAEAEAIVKKGQTPSVIARREATKQSNLEIATLPWVARNDVWKQTVVKTPEPMVVWPSNPARSLEVRVITNPFLTPKTEVLPQVRMKQSRESSPVNISQVQVVEQIVEKKNIVTEQKKDEPKAKKENKRSFLKIKIVEAVAVTRLRLYAVYEAAIKVKDEAEKKGEKVVVTGKKLSKFLAEKFWQYLSPLVKEQGFDGTISLTLRAIESNQMEYTSLEEAQTQLSKPVIKHIPLQQGEGGRVATIEEVREVLEGKDKESLKSQTSAELVARRVVSSIAEEKEEVVGEPTLKSLGLEEVFQKAA